MQIILLLALSFIFAAAAVLITQKFRVERRSHRANLILTGAGILICAVFSVLIEFVIFAAPPQFYYHTHTPGVTTLKVFGAACFSGSCFFALGLMIAERKRQNCTILRHMFFSALLGICAALILEIGFFNFRHFELLGSGAKKRTYPSDRIYPEGFYFNRATWKFHPYTYSGERNLVIYLSNRKVRNISFEFDDGFPRRAVKLDYNDRASRKYVQISDLEFIQGVDRSFTIPLHTVGTTYTIRLDLPDDPDFYTPSYGISLPQIVVNKTVPLSLDPLRFGLCALVIFLISAFRPGSPLWNLPLCFRSIPQILAVCGLILMTFAWFGWTVFSSYSGSDLPITEQKAAQSENYVQYNKLVDALLSRRYSLLETPHRYLEQTDAYDMRAREELDFDYPWDTAYFNGRFYVYFGVVPAVTVLLPYRLLTGKDLDLDYPILMYCCLIVLGVMAVYTWFVRHCFPEISFALYWMGLLMLITALNLTWCLRRTLVYEMAITSGVAFAVWGIFFVLCGGSGGRWKFLCYFLSGTCTALAVGCRPTMIFVSIVVFVIAFYWMKTGSRLFSRENLLNAVLFLVPYMAVGLALMKYNYERFGNVLEFGVTYQLTTENRAAGLPLLGPYGRLLSILGSLFTLPKVDMIFPFIHPQQPYFAYNGQILNEDAVTGVFAYPVMLFLFGLPAAGKRMRKHGKLLMPFCISCLTAASAICVVSSDFSVANRYLTDYLYLAGLPAVFVFFCLYEKASHIRWPKLAQSAALVCVIAGAALFVMLSLTGETDWFRQINPLYYDKLRYAYSPWL